MTITTSKQLAEALGGDFKPAAYWPRPRVYSDKYSVRVDVLTDECVAVKEIYATAATPRAAVLALADRLEAEALALRESVKEGP